MRTRNFGITTVGLAIAFASAGCSAPRASSSHDGPTDSGVLFPPSDVAGTSNEVAETRLDTTPAADGASCVEGAACDDRDSCTINDQCTQGVCRGTAIDCDDHVPCTVDACGSGMCTHTMQTGFCLIGGACWSAEQHNPTNSCQRCRPDDDARAWTNTDGLKCNDDDPCTEGEACQGGVCQGGVTPTEICDNHQDDDCDGKTDGDDSDCGAAGCSYQSDCYPEGVCARHRFTGETRCSVPCAGDAQCQSGEICAKLPGSLQVGYCEEVNPALGARGASCQADAQCQSQICVDQKCASLCLDQAQCTSASDTCHPIGDLAAGFVASACSPNPAGSIANGQVCQVGQEFDGSFCASGHCDLMPFPSEALPCSPICKSESGCSPAQECNIVLYATGANPDAIAYDSQFTQRTYDAVAACYTPPQATAARAVGQSCTSAGQCASYKCMALLPNDPQTYCTSYCEFDAECPSGMRCKLDAVTLVSAWLQNTVVTKQPTAPGAWTLVRMCKFE